MMDEHVSLRNRLDDYDVQLREATGATVYGVPLNDYSRDDLMVLLCVTERDRRRQAEQHAHDVAFLSEVSSFAGGRTP